jgi:hypothetical protein
MIWIITAPVQELLDAMQAGSWAETMECLDEWLEQGRRQPTIAHHPTVRRGAACPSIPPGSAAFE